MVMPRFFLFPVRHFFSSFMVASFPLSFFRQITVAYTRSGSGVIHIYSDGLPSLPTFSKIFVKMMECPYQNDARNFVNLL